MKKAFLKTCALALSLLLATLLFTACGETSGLPSIEEAQTVCPGMTVYEVSQILGRPGIILPTGIFSVAWELENGQALVACCDTRNSIPTITSYQIREHDWDFSSAYDEKNMIAMIRIHTDLKEYEASAAVDDLIVDDPYYDTLRQRFVYASALTCLGEFRKYSFSPWHINSYEYILTDANGMKLELQITPIDTLPGSDYIETLPDGMSNMIHLDPEVGFYVNRNGLVYHYDRSGTLCDIYWLLNNNQFKLSVCASNFEGYPMDEEDTMVKRLLSADDTVASSAFTELKTYITTHNTKPISFQEILIGVGIAVLIVGIGVAVLILLKKKRTGKSAAPETPDTALESTAPSPEVADTATDGTAPLPETPQNE